MIILKKVQTSGSKKYRVQHQITNGLYKIYNLPINGDKSKATQIFSSPITLELIESMALNFSSPEKFYNKFKQIDSIPADVANEFFKKYSANTPMKAVRKMFNEIK